MKGDPLQDLLNTPSGEDDPEGGVYWTMTVGICGPTGEARQSLDADVWPAEKARIEATSPGQTWGVREQFEFTDTAGSRHVWYFVRVIGFIESTPATRDRDRLMKIYAELHFRKMRREQFGQHGERWQEDE